MPLVAGAVGGFLPILVVRSYTPHPLLKWRMTSSKKHHRQLKPTRMTWEIGNKPGSRFLVNSTLFLLISNQLLKLRRSSTQGLSREDSDNCRSLALLRNWLLALAVTSIDIFIDSGFYSLWALRPIVFEVRHLFYVFQQRTENFTKNGFEPRTWPCMLNDYL